ncbi:MAG TPA: glycosyltransferase family 4 protein [Flavisolibacter sp.]|jgi:glycosyltransferase involved in cell wall biosynthesis|nr:glycosyltransferase family 4 protein [Flavisolibacter sp.]
MKTVVIFHLWHGPGHWDLSEQSNVWFARFYESYFDRVYVVTLINDGKENVRQGKTTYLTLGKGSTKTDLLLAPYRLCRLIKKLKPDVLVTYEQVLLFWVLLFRRLCTKSKVYLLPITIPPAMYKVTGKSLSIKLPIWLEKVLISLSYRSTDYALTTTSFGNYIEWLQSEALLNKKLVIVDKLPEALPPPKFFDQISNPTVKSSNKTTLLYVGRLHQEKLVDHLIRMMAILGKENHEYKLIIIGDGNQKEELISLAKQLGVDDVITFLGYVANADLPNYYLSADLFVSPLTGGSLREAALCGLPVVAYDMDWIKDILVHKKTFMAVEPYNYEALATEVKNITADKELKLSISQNIKKLSWELWSPLNLNVSLEKAFGR